MNNVAFVQPAFGRRGSRPRPETQRRTWTDEPLRPILRCVVNPQAEVEAASFRPTCRSGSMRFS